MTIALGVMSVPAPVDGDSIRRYETGTLPDGGLWTALRRLSDHDHTGGDLGTPISVASIPNGSITTDKLDPAVLAPYSLVDGSKPFTGQVTMQADAIVRDTVYFGQQGTADPADATLSRTGPGALRADTHLGVGVNPAAWGPGRGVVQVGTGNVNGLSGASGTTLEDNRYYDGTNYRAVVAAASSALALQNGNVFVANAPAVAAGAVQTFTTRLALSPTGTLTLTPDAGQAALSATLTGGSVVLDSDGAAPRVRSTGTLRLRGDSGYVEAVDNTQHLGSTANRWVAVYAVQGTINTSSREAKQDIAPLDPAACAQAVLDTDWVAFEYTPQPLTPGPPGETVAQSTARVSAHSRMLQETAFARKQRGYVLGSPSHRTSSLFGLEDRQSASPQADLAVVACGLQDALRRIAALEGAAA